jgi:hypothetical protein
VQCDECGIALACIKWAGFRLCLTHASGSKAAASRRDWQVIDQKALVSQAKVVDAVSQLVFELLDLFVLLAPACLAQ